MREPLSSQSIGNRYILHDQLGEGGMGTVYRATDRLMNRDVALKRVLTDTKALHLEDSDDAIDFKLALTREFKLSASLRHPNIVNVLDYGFDNEQQPYYTMELLHNSQTILEAALQRPIRERVALILQVLHALAYLHRRGIMHRDLKPGNVLVVDDRVKVLDFGLSTMHDRSRDDSMSDTTAGTLAYLAPESLIGDEIDHRVDLYAVGMLGYEIIAGDHPFDLSQPSVLINQILSTVPDINELDVDISIGMVVHRLLAKDPDDRYQSAAETIDALNLAHDRPDPVDTEAIRESFLQAARLIGRDAELNTLSDALQHALQGAGNAWLIAGESGVGKTRLIDEIRTLAMVKGALVMRGQAIDVGGQPYHMWQTVLRWMALLAHSLTDRDIALLKRYVDDVDSLLARDTQAIAPAELAADEWQDHLIQLLRLVIVQQQQPVVMLFEDLHWAGSESLAALANLAGFITELPLLVIASYRDDEQLDLHRQFPQMQHMKLERLDEAGIEALSVAMLGDAGHRPQVVNLLKQESEGNVFFIIEVVRALAEETGALDEIGMATLPQRVFAGGIQLVIERRLSRLDDASRHLLRIAAITGRQVDTRIIAHLSETYTLQAWLMKCANAAVLEADDDTWQFAHDKLRVGILELINDDERRTLHHQVAEAIERIYGADEAYIPALAHHWHSAGKLTKEAKYVALAGDLSLRIGAYHEAIQYYERALDIIDALDLSPTAAHRQQIQLRNGIAEAHLGFGDYDRAENHYRMVKAFCRTADDPVGVADATGNLGAIALAQEQFDKAHTLYAESLTLYQRARHNAGIARTLNRLGDVAYETGDQETAKMYYQESLELSREIGEDWGMAGAVRSQTMAATHDTSEALDNLKIILRAVHTNNDRDAVLRTIIRVARAYLKIELFEKALELLAFVLYYDETPDALQDKAETIIFSIEDDLAPDAAARAWEKGKSLSYDDVVTTLLE